MMKMANLPMENLQIIPWDWEDQACRFSLTGECQSLKERRHQKIHGRTLG
jgi:hypothetical protein